MPSILNGLDPVSAGAGAATALGTSIYGAIASSKANKEANRIIAQQKADNLKWYNMKAAEDFSQRSDTQALLKKQKEMLDSTYRQARATQAVAGGTDEALAMQQAAANQAVADSMTNIAAQSSAYKDQAEQQYLQTNNALEQQQVQMQMQKANAVSAAAAQGVTAGLNLIGSGIDKKQS